MPVPPAFFDALIDSPVEVEGSPMMSTDEITAALVIKRSYAQRASLWKKLGWAAPDPFITDAYLVNETPSQRPGPVLFFDRNYAQLPAARTEPRQIAFTLPGRSAVQFSQVTGLPIGWGPYGAIAPQTIPKLAVVSYTYAVQTSQFSDPRALFTVPAESALTYGGARVDFSGTVYVSVGNVSIPQADPNPPIVEPRWRLQGVVGGFASGQDWIVSVSINRWRGPIFVMEVVKIPALILP